MTNVVLFLGDETNDFSSTIGCLRFLNPVVAPS